ncbi:hypothetical protein U1Q18_034552, partial [Sarracenia purpurea var. burkii]
YVNGTWVIFASSPPVKLHLGATTSQQLQAVQLAVNTMLSHMYWDELYNEFPAQFTSSSIQAPISNPGLQELDLGCKGSPVRCYPCQCCMHLSLPCQELWASQWVSYVSGGCHPGESGPFRLCFPIKIKGFHTGRLHVASFSSFY